MKRNNGTLQWLKWVMIIIVMILILSTYFFIPDEWKWISFNKEINFSDFLDACLVIFISFLLPTLISNTIKRRETREGYLSEILVKIDKELEILSLDVNRIYEESLDNEGKERIKKKFLLTMNKIGNYITLFRESNKNLWFLYKDSECETLYNNFLWFYKDVWENINFNDLNAKEAQLNIDEFQKKIYAMREWIL